jgi:hypothetical protein
LGLIWKGNLNYCLNLGSNLAGATVIGNMFSYGADQSIVNQCENSEVLGNVYSINLKNKRKFRS